MADIKINELSGVARAAVNDNDRLIIWRRDGFGTDSEADSNPPGTITVANFEGRLKLVTVALNAAGTILTYTFADGTTIPVDVSTIPGIGGDGVIDARNGYVAPGEDTAAKLRAGDNNLAVTRITQFAEVPNTADFSNFVHFNYIGAFQSDPPIADYSLGSIYWNIRHLKGKRQAVRPVGSSVHWEDYDIENIFAGNGEYQGAWADDDEAVSHLEQSSDVYFNETSNRLRLAGNYVAGSVGHTIAEWRRLLEVGDNALQEIQEHDVDRVAAIASRLDDIESIAPPEWANNGASRLYASANDDLSGAILEAAVFSNTIDYALIPTTNNQIYMRVPDANKVAQYRIRKTTHSGEDVTIYGSEFIFHHTGGGFSYYLHHEVSYPGEEIILQRKTSAFRNRAVSRFGGEVAIDASAFAGNLLDTDDTAQKVADKVDALKVIFKGAWTLGTRASIGEIYTYNDLAWMSSIAENTFDPSFDDDAFWWLLTSRAHWRGAHVIGDRYLSGQFAVKDGIVYLATQDTETTPSADPLRWAAISHPPGSNVSVAAGNFDHALSATDDNVQTALATLDEHQPPATRVTVADAAFAGNLAPGDDTVQKVAAKVDALELTATAQSKSVKAITDEVVNSADIDFAAAGNVYDTTVAVLGFSLPPEGTTKIRFMIGAQDATSSRHPEIRTWDFEDYMRLVETTNQGATDATGLTSVVLPGGTDTVANGEFQRLRVFANVSVDSSQTEPIDFQVGRKADGGMLIASSQAVEDALPLTVTWVVEETFDVVTGIISGAAGQGTPGSAITNGNTFLRLYRWLGSGITPDDPLDEFENGVFRTSFGDWNDTPGLASNSAQVLWVANGGTSLDADGYRQNRAWQIYATLTEQYARIVQDSSTYTLDITTAGVRFVRSLLPTGWGAWKPLEDGTGGWTEVMPWAAAHSTNALNVNEEPFTPVDCTFFNQVRFSIRTFGQYVEGQPDRIGGGDSIIVDKPVDANWTSKFQNASPDATWELGSFKFSWNDEFGLAVSPAVGAFGDNELRANLAPVLPDFPWRRINFIFHAVALGDGTDGNGNLLSRGHIGRYATADALAEARMEMR